MIHYLKIYSMAFILLVAGILHLLRPDLFLKAMPPYIPWHLEIVLFTGVLEILFAFGIVIKVTRFYTSLFLVFYFFVITLSHVHVAVNEIPMFGVRSPLFLWLRLGFQGVFIWWAYSINKNAKCKISKRVSPTH